MAVVTCRERGMDLFLDQSVDCFCKRILDFAHVGILVAKVDGTIKYMNPTFAQMFDLKLPEALNTDICNYFPDSQLLTVMASGKADEGVKFGYKGQDALISRYPITDNGKVIGGLIEVYFRDIVELSGMIRKMNRLEKKLRYYERKTQGLPCARYSVEDIIGCSPEIRDLKSRVETFAKTRHHVLIEGESGVGKELVAHALHAASMRAKEIFVSINCAAIPGELLEAELFGFEEGAFTGAKRGGKVGKFELADRGTIFLDEIGELPLTMQAALLRVIENKEIQKIGKSTPAFSDFRLIAATNKDLALAVQEGTFRRDLYHRLATIVLHVPPLRQRPQDIPLLIEHFLDTMEDGTAKRTVGLSPEALNVFSSYTWPGNIRELKNVLSYALISLGENAAMIKLQHLPPYIIEKSLSLAARPPQNDAAVSSLSQARQKTEFQAITAALEKTGGNKLRAAKLLGISRNVLYKKLRKHGLHGTATPSSQRL